LRKEKLKTEQKEIEKMENENPNEFKEKLEQISKRRMQERMSLKHKNTSKWAKQKAIYSKYNLKVSLITEILSAYNLM
jgi:U3 small nucleolar RNA-associated protein 14